MPDDMNAETLGPGFEATKHTAQPEARSLLNQTVRTEYLPPERFRGDPHGQIVEIKKIGEMVATVRRVAGHYEASIYDGRGNQTAVVLDPSTKNLGEMGEKEYVKVKPDDSSPDDEDPLLIFQRMGFSKKDSEYFREQFYASRRFDYGYIQTQELVSQQAKYFSAGHWEVGVVSSTEGSANDKFIFQAEHGHFVIDPKTPSSKTPVEGDYDTNEMQLNDNLLIRRGATVFSLHSQGREMASYTGINPVVDPANPDNILFVNGGRIYSLDTAGAINRTATPRLESQIETTDIKEVQIDPNGNFFVVHSGSNQLLVIDRESGEVANSFDNVLGPILVDNQGDILLVDSQGKLREIQTNFQAIPTGGSESAREKREEQLRQMQERFSTLELGKVQRQRGEGITEEDVANTLREAIARQVSEPLAKATDPNAIEDIMDRLQGLKAEPANQAYGEVIDEFVSRARDKLSGIRTAEFDSQLGEYEKSLEGVQSVGDTIGLDEEFTRLLELRQKTDITDPATRRNIEQRLREIQTRKDTIVGQYQQELSDAIQQAFPNIEQLIREAGSSQELAMFGTTVEAQHFEMMLANIRDPQARRELRDRLNSVKAEQRTGLEARGRQLEEEQRLRWAQVVEEAKEDLDSLRVQITEFSEAREIDRFERNPLVTAWRAKIFALPPELREIEEKKLEIILGSRKKDIEHRKELGAVGDTGELKFGNVSFPVYREPPRIWQPVFLPIKGGMTGYADLVFQDGQGKIWHPDPDHRIPVIADINHEQTARLVDRYRREAEEYFKGLRREVPEYSDRWRIAEYQMKKLEELAESLNIQVDNHMGITILEGEAGTGKSALADILANLSNREVINIACNENTVKEDLTYEFYYDPERGTYKLPARLVEGIKKPGVIILFEEINTIKPGVVKMLNPLFDYKRRLIVNEGGVQNETLVDPTVILLGTMNPQNYAGVAPLAETILSRADVIEVGYPPFDQMAGGRTRYRSDEAEMLYSYVHVLENLQQREFKLAWDHIINRDTTNGGDMLLKANPNLEKDIRRLYDAIRVANRLRGMYQAYQVGESNEPMDFTTSLREMVNIALRLNHAQNVRDVASRVILPKIGDRRQRVMVDQTIKAVLP